MSLNDKEINAWVRNILSDQTLILKAKHKKRKSFPCSPIMQRHCARLYAVCHCTRLSQGKRKEVGGESQLTPVGWWGGGASDACWMETSQLGKYDSLLHLIHSVSVDPKQLQVNWKERATELEVARRSVVIFDDDDDEAWGAEHERMENSFECQSKHFTHLVINKLIFPFLSLCGSLLTAAPFQLERGLAVGFR